MGYIKHHTIVVTGWQTEAVEEAREKAVEIFKKSCEEEILMTGSNILVSEIIGGLVNSQNSFFIAPDGSKEGWGTSDNCNNARAAFLDWLEGSNNYCDYIEVVFGGDDEHESIIRSKNTDLDEY